MYEFSTGWKILLDTLLTQTYNEPVRGLICPYAEGYFNLVNPKWRLQAELSRLHATTPLWYKNIDSYGVQTGPVNIFHLYS